MPPTRTYTVQQLAAVEQIYGDISYSAREAYRRIGELLGVTADSARGLVGRQGWKRSGRHNHRTPSDTPSLSRRIDDERERARRQADIATLKELTGKRAVIAEWTAAIRSSALAMPVPVLWDVVSHPHGDEETALLLLSDVHVGMDTPARMTAGFVTNQETTHQQFKLLAEKVVSFWKAHADGNRPWSTLVILDLGDDVEGSHMRPSQARIANPLVTDQVRLYGQWLAEFATTLLQVFKHIRIERVPGNHGRVSQRAGIAGLDELDPANSFDLLAGKFTEAILAPAIQEGRAVIINHETYAARTEIANQRIIFEHGSSLRGGTSLGIPAYGINRAAANYLRLYGEFDLLCFGHWHQPMLMTAGERAKIVVNGAFPPTTPFITGDLHGIGKPTQILMSLHEEHGVTGYYPLYLPIKRSLP